MHPLLFFRKAGLWGDQEPDSQDTPLLPLTPQYALDTSPCFYSSVHVICQRPPLTTLFKDKPFLAILFHYY